MSYNYFGMVTPLSIFIQYTTVLSEEKTF